MNPPTRSARDLIAHFFDREIPIIPRESDYTIGTTATAIGKYARQRVAFYLANTGTTTFAFGWNSGVTSTTGLILNAGQSVTFAWWPDGELVMHDLYAISSGAGGTLHIVESVLMGI